MERGSGGLEEVGLFYVLAIEMVTGSGRGGGRGAEIQTDMLKDVFLQNNTFEMAERLWERH